MADGIKISALTEATDAQTVDGNLLETAVVDTSSSTGFSSKKTPISRLAQYVLNKFTGLSLGGSAQTVKSAIDSLNSNTYSLLIGTAITSGADLNAYTTAGNFYSASSTITNSLLNAPFTGYGFKMHVEYINSNGTILQTIASGHMPSQNYERRGQRASGSWTFSDWKEQPTRAEMDAISSKMQMFEVLGKSSKTITFSAYATNALIWGAESGSTSGLAFYVYTNGFLIPLYTATSLSASISSDYKTVTISNSATGRRLLGAINLGTASMTIA